MKCKLEYEVLRLYVFIDLATHAFDEIKTIDSMSVK